MNNPRSSSAGRDGGTTRAPGSAAAEGSSPLGVVHCFVEHEELRRLLANMAAIELLSVMLQTRA